MYFMIYGIFVNRNWVDTRWQQYSNHLHTYSTQNNKMTQNTLNGTYITIRTHKRYLCRIKQKHTKHTTIYTMIQNRKKNFVIKANDMHNFSNLFDKVIQQINLRICKFRWLLLQEYITMHGPLNIESQRTKRVRKNVIHESAL